MEYSQAIQYQTQFFQAGQWVELEQIEIPLGQQAATAQDVRNMLMMASQGQPARAYRSGRCPVDRSFVDDKIVARATLKFYIHHSKELEYTITPSVGYISDQFSKNEMREKRIKTDYRGQVFLGLAFDNDNFHYEFESKCYDRKRKHVMNPEVIYDDGYLYIRDTVWAIMNIWGTASFDEYSLTIEHELGRKFDSNIFILAEYKQEETATAKKFDIELPKCVLDAFNKCPYSDSITIKPKRGTALIEYSGCNGKVLNIYEDEEI